MSCKREREKKKSEMIFKKKKRKKKSLHCKNKMKGNFNTTI